MTGAQLSRARLDGLRRLRWQRQVEQICRTPRLVFELLDEIRRHHAGIADDLDRRLASYAELDPNTLRRVGGDRFAAAPLRLVERVGGAPMRSATAAQAFGSGKWGGP